MDLACLFWFSYRLWFVFSRVEFDVLAFTFYHLAIGEPREIGRIGCQIRDCRGYGGLWLPLQPECWVHLVQPIFEVSCHSLEEWWLGALDFEVELSWIQKFCHQVLGIGGYRWFICLEEWRIDDLSIIWFWTKRVMRFDFVALLLECLKFAGGVHGMAVFFSLELHHR